jgi:DNA-binding transcriptional LysR family regulator
MNHFHDEIELLVVICEPLMRPGHGIGSLSQLSRRVRVGDDLLRRTLTKCEERFHGPLIGVENHRLQVTALGRRVLEPASRLVALTENGQDICETLTVEIAPCLAEGGLLTESLTAFLQPFSGLIRLRFCDLDIGAVRENISDRRTTAFGIGFAAEDEEPRSGMELLPAKLAWTVLISPNSSLHGNSGPVAGNDLHPDSRIFLPAEAQGLPGFRQWLQKVEPAYQTECSSPGLIRRLVRAGQGLGVALDLGGDAEDGLAVRPISGVEKQRVCLYLPRRAADLSEPARALLDGVRRFVGELQGGTRVRGAKKTAAEHRNGEIPSRPEQPAETLFPAEPPGVPELPASNDVLPEAIPVKVLEETVP